VKKLALCIALLGIYVGIQIPLTRYMADRPVAEQVGFIAHPQLMRLSSADHKETAGALLSIKALMYYGTLVEEARAGNPVTVDYDGLYRLLSAASALDPYNMDSYYFSQAILAWEPDFMPQVLELLRRGMEYRDWDWMLPFWAGFDTANFLKDYDTAATYYRRAAELSGAELFASLTSRYLYEADQTELAINYLEAMLKGATKPAIRQTFELRLDALKKMRMIEEAIAAFRLREAKGPGTLEALVRSGDLSAIPEDPYGGEFYLDDTGKPRSSRLFNAPQPRSL